MLPIDVGTPLDEILELADRFCASAIVLPTTVVAGRVPNAVALDDELVGDPARRRRPARRTAARRC